jgi:glyoxylase I family protein
MGMQSARACVAVANLQASLQWYEKLLGKVQDVWLSMDMAEWKLPESGWLQLFHDSSRAGSSIAMIIVSDLDIQLKELGRIGIGYGTPVKTRDRHFVAVEDPDGNQIRFAEWLPLVKK